MPLAMSDVESPPATKAAILTSASVSASRPETPRGPVPAAHVVIDTVGGAVLDGSHGLLREGGRLVTLGAPRTRSWRAGTRSTLIVHGTADAAIPPARGRSARDDLGR